MECNELGLEIVVRVTIYSIEHLIINKKAGPGWISYSREGACYTFFKTTILQLNFSSQGGFLILLLRIRCPTLYRSRWLENKILKSVPPEHANVDGHHYGAVYKRPNLKHPPANAFVEIEQLTA